MSFGCEVGTILIRQGHAPGECYFILFGKFRDSENIKAQTFVSEIFCKAEERDFIVLGVYIQILKNSQKPHKIFKIAFLKANKESQCFDNYLLSFLLRLE